MRSHSKAFFAVAALFAFLLLAPFAQAAPKKVVGFFGQYGTAAGEFTIPDDAAINQSSGDVYVIDSAQSNEGGYRIEQFTADGEFIRAWGWGVATGANEFEICTTSCGPGIPGSGNGQISVDVGSPTQIAVDQSDGSVYFADTSHHRVQKFSADGDYLDQFGTFGSAGGELSGPRGVAVDPVSGDLYVADTGNSRIQRFDSEGNFVSALGLDVVVPGGTGEVLTLVNERQSVKPVGEFNLGCFCLTPPTGGTFTLSFEGQTSTDLAFDASAATVDAEMEALSSIGAGNVEVTGSDGGPFQVEFTAALGGTDVSQISGDGTSLEPPGAFVEASTSREGAQVPGVEVCTVAIECQAGAVGSGPGELNSPQQIDVDSTGRLYVLEGSGRVQRFSPSGAFEEVFAPGEASGSMLAVDPANDHVYVGREISGGQTDARKVEISEFDSAGAFVELHQLGGGQIGATISGLAVRSSTGRIYVPGSSFDLADVPNVPGRASDTGVAVLGAVNDPTASIEAVTDIAGNQATFHGIVNPQGGPPEARYRFEHSTDGVNWSRVGIFDVSLGEGTSDIAVTQTATQLDALTEYHVRLVATKKFGAGSATSPEVTFTTTGAAPKVDPLWPGPVTDTTAWLGARVNPQNADTIYYVEYSTNPGFANSTSFPTSEDNSAGSGKAFVLSVDEVEGLAPGTTYHYRVVAENAAGTTIGESRSFETLAGETSQGLPDGRVWEKVSPASKGGADIRATTGSGVIFGWRAQGAADGSAVAFGSGGKFGGAFGGEGGSVTSQYLAKRGPGGWSTEGINPRIDPGGTGEGFNLYDWFSEDLRYGILRSTTPLTPDAAPGVSNTYRRDNETGAIELLSPGVTGTPPYSATFYFRWAVGDGSHAVVFRDGGLTYERLPNGDVRALPAGGVLGATATTTAGAAEPDKRLTGPNAVSADGSRVFFHTPSGSSIGDEGNLFRIEDGQSTVHVSASERSGANPDKPTQAIFYGASTDGSVAYFTSKEALTDTSNPLPDCKGLLPAATDAVECETLYRWDGNEPAGERLTDLTDQDPQGRHVLGVTALSDDGDSVYFVAAGDLTESGSRASGLYLWREGEGLRLIARVSRAVALTTGDAGELWSRELGTKGYREARVTPDGRYLAFSSRDSLTAYETNGTAQIYLYDSETSRISCMSCGSVQPEATGGSWFLCIIPNRHDCGSSSSEGSSTEYLVRNLSTDGKRFVFNSKDALVPEDSNGALDVYQWQEGRLHLLSSGTSAFPSKLLDASASGDDVFFTTAQRLTRSDKDDLRDLYDAKVGGVPEPDITPPCVADECQGTPKPAPTFQTPSSSGTQGAGNLQQGKPRCAKGKVRRKGRCVRKVRKASKRQNAKKANDNRRASR